MKRHDGGAAGGQKAPANFASRLERRTNREILMSGYKRVQWQSVFTASFKPGAWVRCISNLKRLELAPYCKMHNLTNTNLFKCDMYLLIFTCSTQMDGFSPWTLNGGGEKHCTFIISSAERHTRLFAYKGKQLCNGRVALSAALTHLFIYSLMPRSAVSRAQRRPNRAPVNLWKGHIITDKGERERKKKVASITKY